MTDRDTPTASPDAPAGRAVHPTQRCEFDTGDRTVLWWSLQSTRPVRTTVRVAWSLPGDVGPATVRAYPTRHGGEWDGRDGRLVLRSTVPPWGEETAGFDLPARAVSVGDPVVGRPQRAARPGRR